MGRPRHEVTEIKDGTEVIEKIEDRISGRVALEDIVHPVTGEMLVEADAEITEEDAGLSQKQVLLR